MGSTKTTLSKPEALNFSIPMGPSENTVSRSLLTIMSPLLDTKPLFVIFLFILAVESFELETPKSGIDFSIRAGNKEGDTDKLDIVLLISDSIGWTSIKASYIVTSREDFWAGSYIVDTFTILDCNPANRKDELSTSLVVPGWERSRKAKALVFISGLRTEDYSFDVSVKESSFDIKTGLLETLVYSNAFPNIEIIHLNYVIYLESAPFIFGDFSAEVADYIFAGAVSHKVSKYSEIVTESLAFISDTLTCRGAGCQETCLTEKECKAAKGKIIDRICYICGDN